MTIFQSIVLALIQGVTEFLPVSSSGHLVLLQKFMGIENPPIFFDVLMHFGTMISVVLFFRREILKLFIHWQSNLKTWLLIIVGSIPAGIFGLFLSTQIEEIFSSIKLLGIMWFIFGLMLLFLRVYKPKSEKENIHDLGFIDAFIIGLFQALALFPGISRSGSTIFGGMFRKLNYKSAFLFSFLLSLPAVLGANILMFREELISPVSMNIPLYFFSVIIAGMSGFFALKILKKVLIADKIHLFGFYCLILGFLVIFLN